MQGATLGFFRKNNQMQTSLDGRGKIPAKACAGSGWPCEFVRLHLSQ